MILSLRAKSAQVASSILAVPETRPPPWIQSSAGVVPARAEGRYTRPRTGSLTSVTSTPAPGRGRISRDAAGVAGSIHGRLTTPRGRSHETRRRSEWISVTAPPVSEFLGLPLISASPLTRPTSVAQGQDESSVRQRLSDDRTASLARRGVHRFATSGAARRAWPCRRCSSPRSLR